MSLQSLLDRIMRRPQPVAPHVHSATLQLQPERNQIYRAWFDKPLKATAAAIKLYGEKAINEAYRHLQDVARQRGSIGREQVFESEVRHQPAGWSIAELVADEARPNLVIWEGEDCVTAFLSAEQDATAQNGTRHRAKPLTPAITRR